ncbi:MAG: helix-turn-helix domain-containing protein [Thermoplasmatota archaeon]
MRPTARGERNRAILLALIENRPGMTFRSLVAASGIASGTTRHHLNVLVRQRRIWYARIGCRLAHYPGAQPTTDAERLYAMLAGLDGLDRTLLAVMALGDVRGQRPFLDAAQGVPRSTVQNRLERLQARGFITRLAGPCHTYRALNRSASGAGAPVASGEPDPALRPLFCGSQGDPPRTLRQILVFEKWRGTVAHGKCIELDADVVPLSSTKQGPRGAH